MKTIETLAQIIALDVPEAQRDKIAFCTGLGEVDQSGDQFFARYNGHTFLIQPDGKLVEL